MNGTVRELRILCEGVYDRAFWDGMLLNVFQATSLKEPGKLSPKEPSGRTLPPGDHAYQAGGSFVRVRQCGGKQQVFGALPGALRAADVRAIVVNTDLDCEVGEADATRLSDSQSVVSAAQAEGYTLDERGPGVWQLREGPLMCFVPWCAAESVSAQQGIPTQLCLERLVCTALSAAHPARGTSVWAWLNPTVGPSASENAAAASPPPAVSVSPKAYAFSHMARWYPEAGCYDFFKHVWREEALRRRLLSSLELLPAFVALRAILAPGSND